MAANVFVHSPDRVVARVCTQIANERGRPQDLHLDLMANTPTHIGEADLIKVTSELVSNAFDFSKPGTVVLVSSRVDGECYRLDLADLGRGMKPDEIKQIGALIQFDRAIYEQQGVGLGLIISKRIVEFYDGMLTIESRVGMGTIVHVVLPVSTNSEPAIY